jgi:DNA topoisomerase-6 subunit B
MSIDTAQQQGRLHVDQEIEWEKDHGTRVEIEMEARYQKGLRSVDMYLKQTAIANPHVTLHYVDPGGEQVGLRAQRRRRCPRPSRRSSRTRTASSWGA